MPMTAGRQQIIVLMLAILAVLSCGDSDSSIASSTPTTASPVIGPTEPPVTTPTPAPPPSSGQSASLVVEATEPPGTTPTAMPVPSLGQIASPVVGATGPPATKLAAPTPGATDPTLKPSPTETAIPATVPPQPKPASAVTHQPADMSDINGMHEVLRSDNSLILFGTQADPKTVTLGPTNVGVTDWPAYDGKHSLNIKMPLMTPITAPLDMEFVGFKNRSASYRQDTPESFRMEPFDDLELCLESVSADWSGMIVCVYHLKTTPLLQAHLKHEDCGIQDRWDGGGAEKGRIYYLKNSYDESHRNPESCEPLLGAIL
jgi:hypothetical protein